MPTSYISVRTALYGFAPGRDDGHGRLEVRAGQTLLLLDTSDHEWWKFKIKTNRQHNDGDSGLVPKMLTKEAEFISSAIACRDFIARADGDLTIIEDESLSVYCVDGDWVLVKGTLGAGYVPKKCVELEQEINQTNDILQSQVPEPEEPDFPEEAASITPDHEEPHWWGGGDADSDHLINTMPQDQINISPRSNFGFGSTTAWYEPASQRSGMITSRSVSDDLIGIVSERCFKCDCRTLQRLWHYWQLMAART
ncbi:hypothetical protein B0J17DRAFT_684645 [Rhizoctonia solani]|nr:hypothetical protein B0J17DRAFT_684645 [Rhizoctonia solani]